MQAEKREQEMYKNSKKIQRKTKVIQKDALTEMRQQADERQQER
jgi:hypothetical protein